MSEVFGLMQSKKACNLKEKKKKHMEEFTFV